MPQPKNKLATAKIGKASGKSPDLVQPASAPQPTRDGNSTLTRALGLKIGRIVIDAGHGGHDTGTIGPTGLMEKDLCLDIALRLGKIIQQKLPSADVVYTRSDDTFIPLEERTHIANEAKADMFISIHANSSQDPGARGIETYYLNLKGSAEAMEVAARENATDDQGIHELQDLVKQIARTEKIDESKEFAEDVQDSLAKRVQKAAKPVKNRGVRKAPFVVLIGADMPSILTEISFLSNPADEKMLKQPDHRQRVAEGIYQGVASYLQSLNSMTVNQSSTPCPQAHHHLGRGRIISQPKLGFLVSNRLTGMNRYSRFALYCMAAAICAVAPATFAQQQAHILPKHFGKWASGVGPGAESKLLPPMTRLRMRPVVRVRSFTWYSDGKRSIRVFAGRVP